jgi:hypothetical protein
MVHNGLSSITKGFQLKLSWPKLVNNNGLGIPEYDKKKII